MNYLDVNFPIELNEYFSSETEFSTSKAILKNRNELRNINWEEPRKKYKLIYKNLNIKNYQKLQSFFFICQGCYHSFNFFDKNDNQIELQKIATADGQTTDFEIFKNYSYDNLSIKKRIYKTTNEKVYINNNLVNNYKYTIHDGIISFYQQYVPKMNDVITIKCNFYIIVRFENDTINITKKNNTIEIENLSLVEVKK